MKDQGKSQMVRLVDVFVLGPFMIWTASRKHLPPLSRLLLGVSGLATIVYNGVNYARISEQQD